MNKFIRNNQKKLLAVFSAFLMVMFFLPTSGKTGSGGVDHVVGTLGGVKVTARQMQAVRDEWQQLVMLRFRDPNDLQRQPTPLVSEVLGPEIAGQINQNKDTFFLLLQEARKQGIVVDAEDMESLIHNNIDPTPTDDDQIEQLKPAISDLLYVRALLTRAQEMVKVSRPMIDLAMAREEQTLVLKVALFHASTYLDKIPTPTPTQIRNQYDGFSDRLPDQFGAPGDPLGFGYKYPGRVKIDYIGLTHDEVRLAAKKAKSDVDWNIAAFGEFQKDREYFDSLSVPVLATRPSTRPGAAAQAAATQPSTNPTEEVKKIDDIDADFALHSEVVLKSLYEEEAQTLSQTIMKKISDTMNSDYSAWNEAQSGRGASTRPASSLGPPYDSHEYVDALAQSIQKQFGVMPTFGNVDRFESAKELGELPGLGKSILPLSRQQAIGFPIYATELAKGLASSSSTMTLASWQPSPTFENGMDGYLFRINAVDQPHSAPFQDVHDRIIRDWKLAQAYEMAVKEARDVQANSQTMGLSRAADRVSTNVITTKSFNAEEVKKQNDTAEIEPLKVAPRAAVHLASAAEQLLNAAPESDQRPTSVVELFGDATAAVIEIDSATPKWSQATANLYQTKKAYTIGEQLSDFLMNQLVQYDAVTARLKWKPEATK